MPKIWWSLAPTARRIAISRRRSALILGSFEISALYIAAFVVVEQRTSSLMLPLHFFRRRDFSAAVLIIGLMFFAGVATFFFLPQFF